MNEATSRANRDDGERASPLPPPERFPHPPAAPSHPPVSGRRALRRTPSPRGGSDDVCGSRAGPPSPAAGIDPGVRPRATRCAQCARIRSPAWRDARTWNSAARSRARRPPQHSDQRPARVPSPGPRTGARSGGCVALGQAPERGEARDVVQVGHLDQRGGFLTRRGLGGRRGRGIRRVVRHARRIACDAGGGPGWLGMKRETHSRASMGRSRKGRWGAPRSRGRNGGRSSPRSRRTRSRVLPRPPRRPPPRPRPRPRPRHIVGFHSRHRRWSGLGLGEMACRNAARTLSWAQGQRSRTASAAAPAASSDAADSPRLAGASAATGVTAVTAVAGA